MGGRVVPTERAPVRRSNTMPPNLGNSGILSRAGIEERPSTGTHTHTHTKYSLVPRAGIDLLTLVVQCDQNKYTVGSKKNSS